jgi:hypothetical protein
VFSLFDSSFEFFDPTPFLDHSLESFVVRVLEKDVIASIAAIQGMVDAAGNIRAKRARHDMDPK